MDGPSNIRHSMKRRERVDLMQNAFGLQPSAQVAGEDGICKCCTACPAMDVVVI